MKVVIDLQGAQTESRYRGIGRYSAGLSRAMARNAGPHEIWIALNGLFPATIEPIRAAFDGLIPQERIRVFDLPGPIAETGPASAWCARVSECIRENFFFDLRPDVVLTSSLFEADTTATVAEYAASGANALILYDLIPLLREDAYFRTPGLRDRYYRKVESARRAELLLSISEFSRREGLEHLQLPPERIVNISCAADDCFRSLEVSAGARERIFCRYGINEAFILYTGGVDERKNLDRLLEAYTRLAPRLREQHQLVIAGKIYAENEEYLANLLDRYRLSDRRVIFTGYVSDDDLVLLYNLCSVFVFASLHEGFGLPALEAMACGAAVIGSNTTSVPEVIGREDALFDPMSTQAIAEKLAGVLSNREYARSLREHSLRQAAKFSWDNSAAKAFAALEALRRPDCTHLDSTRIEEAVDTGRRLEKMIERIAMLDGAADARNDWLNVANALAANFSVSGGEKRLLVDVTEFAGRDDKTGIQRAVKGILTQLTAAPPEGYRVEPVWAALETPYRYAGEVFGSAADKFNGASPDDIVSARTGDVFLGLDYAPLWVPYHQDWFQSLRDHGVKIVFVVYDLLPVLRRDCFPPDACEHYSNWLKAVVENSDGVVCISRAVALQLGEWLGGQRFARARPFRIGWFHLGADVKVGVLPGSLRPEVTTMLEKLRSAPAVLMVGTLEPRKGYAQALAAFERLWAGNIEANLVIVGKQGWMMEPLVKRIRSHPELGRRLYWYKGASDEVLALLYGASTGLLMASEGEGFGLPLIEAARHGRPILARDMPVFREIAGEFATYFSGNTPDALADHLRQWLAMLRAGTAPKSDEMPHLTWAESTHQLMQVVLKDGWQSSWMRA